MLCDTVVPLLYDFHIAREAKSHERGSLILEGWKNVKLAESYRGGGGATVLSNRDYKTSWISDSHKV